MATNNALNDASAPFTVTSGNLTVTAGNALLPTTSSTAGQIQINTARVLHTFGTNNTWLGATAGNFTLTVGNAVRNVAIGTSALVDITTGSDNTACGYTALNDVQAGGYNTAVGSLAAEKIQAGTKNTAIGYQALGVVESGVQNIAIGYQAGNSCTAADHGNILIGNSGTAGDVHKIRLGTQGTGDGQQDTCYIAGIYNTAVGATAGVVLSDSSHQVGGLAGAANTVFVGGTKPSFTATPQCTDLTLTGLLKLPTTSSTVGQIQINSARVFHTYIGGAGGGNTNLFIGQNAGNFTHSSTYNQNLAVGTNCLTALTSGYGNTGLGIGSLSSLNTGIGNNAIGINCLSSLTSGKQNNILGSSGADSITTGSWNTMVGCSIGQSLTTGNHNLFLGATNYTTDGGVNYSGSGYAYTSSESSNILLENGGVVGESNKIRIGTQGSGIGQQNACYIAGIYGVTPGGTLNAALIDSNGQLGSVASLAVAQGGTGAATLTDHGVLVGSGTGAITPLGVATDGQLIIGSSGADPVLATLTAGTNITVTNAAGAITVASTTVGINNQTDSYQLVAGDAGKLITMTKASANTLTVPKDATVNFTVGTQILVYQGGAGVTSIAPEDGTITIRSAGALLDLYAQYSVASLIKSANNEWSLSGDLG